MLTSQKDNINDARYSMWSIVKQTSLNISIILTLSTEEFPNKEQDLPSDLVQFIALYSNVMLYWTDKDTKLLKRLYPAINMLNDEDIIILGSDDIMFQSDFISRRLYDFQKSNYKIAITGREKKGILPLTTGSIFKKKMLNGWNLFLQSDDILENIYNDEFINAYILYLNGYKIEMCSSYDTNNYIFFARHNCYQIEYKRVKKYLNKRVNELYNVDIKEAIKMKKPLSSFYDKAIICIFNYRHDDNAKKLYNMFSKYFKTFVLDSGNDHIEPSFIQYPNIYYSGLFNKMKELSSVYDAQYIGQICSDVEIDEETVEKISKEVNKFDEHNIGIWQPGVNWDSRFNWASQKIFGLDNKIIESSFIEGWMHFIKASILENIPFVNTKENKYGYGIDIYESYMSNKLGYINIINNKIKVYNPKDTGYNMDQAALQGDIYLLKLTGHDIRYYVNNYMVKEFIKKNCIMFVCHSINAYIKNQILKLRNELNKEKYDIYILVNSEVLLNINIDGVSQYIFNKKIIQEHGFIMNYYYCDQKGDFYGNNFEYSFMSFYMDHPEYDFYWLIEWDVYCNGNWNNVLSYYDQFSDVDLYTTNIDIGDGEWQSKWPHTSCIWIQNTFKSNKHNLFKCFNPIDRFSNKALKLLVDTYKKGDYGFYELAMPTIFYNNNLIIKSFGYKKDYDEKYYHQYQPGEIEYINDQTVQFNHKYKLEEMIKNKVYHPVKNISGDIENIENVYFMITSWKKRINDVKYTLYSIINQSISVKIILTLSSEEFPDKEKELPSDLLQVIQNFNISLYWTDKNTKSIKKLFPAINTLNDEDIIISADDDILFQTDFAEQRLQEFRKTNYNSAITGQIKTWRPGIMTLSSGTIFKKKMLNGWELFLNSDTLKDVYEDDHINAYILYLNGYNAISCTVYNVFQYNFFIDMNYISKSNKEQINIANKQLDLRVNELYGYSLEDAIKTNKHLTDF